MQCVCIWRNPRKVSLVEGKHKTRSRERKSVWKLETMVRKVIIEIHKNLASMKHKIWNHHKFELVGH